MNEATLEARIDSELKMLFPCIDQVSFTHQKYFSLKLGHNVLSSKDFRDKIGGRLDVLIHYKSKPLAVLELKSPNELLNEDDRDQGISYARLLTPIPPLVIISNGNTSEFYNAHTKELWIKQNINDEIIEMLFKQATKLAADERDETIRILLGQQPKIWHNIIKQYTHKTLEQQEGTIDNYQKPLVKDFNLSREMVSEIYTLASKETLIALVGPPLSGKTNVLSQYCHSNSFDDQVPLYINAIDAKYGIFQLLSNQFTKNIFHYTTTDKVRHWLISSLNQQNDGRLIIIIDGLFYDENNTKIIDEINELINLNNGNFTIIIATDSNTFDNISKISGRTNLNQIGINSKKLELFPLNDNEFDKAKDYFINNYRLSFHNGIQHNVELHNPRLLRLLFTKYASKNIRNQETIGMLPSITTIDILDHIWNSFACDCTLSEDLRIFSKAFINDENERNYNEDFYLMAYGQGCLTYETAEKNIGEKRIARLQQQGYLRLVKGKNGKTIVFLNPPELLSSAAVHYLADEVIKLYRAKNINAAFDYLLNNSEIFPYGDLVASAAILRITSLDETFLTPMIYKLLDCPPKIENINNARILMYFSDIGSHKFENFSGTVVKNRHPWLILSHLTCLKLSDETFRLELIAKLGSFQDILKRFDVVQSKDMKGYHVHEIAGHGCTLCHQMGIIEPITFAIQRGFYENPGEMLSFCEHAKKNNLYNLAYRLSCAANSVTSCVVPEIAETSRKALKILDFKKNFFDHTSKPISKKVGRNELCPCGSNIKYKKCCLNKK